jgi:hypothetical protein
MAGSHQSIYTGYNAVTRVSGGTVSSSDGFIYHTFSSPGTFISSIVSSFVSGSYSTQKDYEVVAIGGGGGGGGSDQVSGGGGGAGGISYGVLNLLELIGTFTVSVGGGGGAGASQVTGTGGGTAGTNGGGTGGNAGGSGNSGGGGGGGGWSGIHTPTIYYVVGGGGAGGGGANEGSANDIPARGGGSPENVYRNDSTTGTNGLNFPGDGGGFGGCGGGVSSVSGGAGGGSGNTNQYGGSNFINSTSIISELYDGGNGASPANATAGLKSSLFLNRNPSWQSFIPAPSGNGGAGNGGAGSAGIVVIRYKGVIIP